MLDLTGIMFSSLMMLVVIVQAVRADQNEPWFQRIRRKEKPSPEAKRPWQRRP
ncbi:MAG TPA: hypothetical protein VGC09_20595 [Rhodopila sp.]